MAIKDVSCKVAACDGCGEEYESVDGVVTHYETAAAAESDLENYNWLVFEGKHFCEYCRPGCRCGHSFGEHDYGEAWCESCTCEKFDPLPVVRNPTR